MEPGEQEPSVLRGLPLSGTVREALDNAAERCEPDRPLQTGMVLEALIEADAHGDWDRVWPSHDGSAEALLASDDDTNALASDDRWRHADLSEDLLAALHLLAETTRRYAMDLIQPGALALALASIPEGSASRQMSRLSGYSTTELIDLIQSDLLGTVLEGFSGAAQPATEGTTARPGALLSIAGLLAAAACAFGAWQALRLIVGPLGGAVLALGVLLAMLPAIRRKSGTRESSAEQDVLRRWAVANFLHPLKLSVLLIVVSFLTYLVVNRHRFSTIFPLVATIAVFLLIVVVVVSGFTSADERSGKGRRKRRHSWFPAETRYHRLPIICAIITGSVVTIAAGLFQFNSQHYSLAPNALLPDKWLTAALFDSALGGWLPLWYWTVLVFPAAAAGGYLMGAAVWVASKVRHTATDRSWRWHAVAAFLIGATVIVSGNLPQLPLNYPAIKGPLYTFLRKFPTYPDAITLNSTISFNELQWTYVGPAEAIATGYVQVSIGESLQGIPVDVVFLKPRLCRVESAYLHVTADVFTQVQIRPLFGALPSSLAAHYPITGACA